MTLKPTIIGDTECWPNFWLFAAKRVSDGRIITLEKSARSELDRERLRKIITGHMTVGYNWRAYDLAMIWAAINGYTNAQLKSLNDQIIVGRVPWWKLEDLLEFRFPETEYIDLIEPQPNPIASLKLLNGRLHGPQLQDLPFEPDVPLSYEQMDAAIGYCGNDLDATQRLFDALAEPLALREQIGRDIGLDVRSKSDTQMGFAILKKRIEDATGKRIGKPPNLVGTTFYASLPDYLNFRTPQLQEMLSRLRGYQFVVQPNGKVELPKWLSDMKLSIGNAVYQMGIGGLHSTEWSRSLWSDMAGVLYDADVGSYYPALILALCQAFGIAPPALGDTVVPVYRGIRDERMEAKDRAKTAEDPKKKVRFKNIAEALKIAMNGGLFGNTGNPHSAAYFPKLLISVTLTGQLALLMLIEWLEAAGIECVSGNTDGVTFMCPRDRANKIGAGDRLLDWFSNIEAEVDAHWEGRGEIPYGLTLKEITDRWEKETGLDLEFVEYKSLHNASVNSYFAIKPDGKTKRKGALGNWWAENDMRGMLMHNPSMTICSDAALAFIKDGIPVAETIRACKDVRQFLTVVNVTGGGTWRGDLLGKVVRYVWSTDGDPILYKKANPTTGNHKKVAKTDGCRPMMRLEETLPADLDYDRYIEAAHEILRDVGVFKPRPAPPRKVRFTPVQALMFSCIFP